MFELLSGVRTAGERETVERFLAALKILPFDAAAAESAAEIRRSLEEEGTPRTTADCLIAGICRIHGAVLLTRNRKHFQRVAGLTLGHLSPTD